MNYAYQQPQQQLNDTNPSCRQLMLQPPQFSPHWQAPYPQNIQGAPQSLINDLPHIANAVGNYAGQVATTNPAYTYYFNLIGYNQFRNEFFNQLVEFAARYFLLLVEQRAAANQQDALNQASMYSVQMMASVSVLKNQALQMLIPGEIWNSCIQIASKLQSVVNQFNNQGQQGGYGGGYQQQPQQAGYGGNTGYNRPVGVVVEPFQPINVTQPQVGPDGNFYVDTTRSRRAVVSPATTPVTAAVDASKQFFTIPGQPTVKEPVKASPPPQAGATVVHMAAGQGTTVSDVNYHVMGMEKPVNINWVPSPNQLFKPAYDSNYQHMVIERLKMADGKTFNNIATIMENPEMNRADHAISTAQALYRSMSKTKEPRVQLVSNDLDLAARALTAMASRETDEATATLRNLGVVETECRYSGEDSLIGFLTTARLRRLEVQTPGEHKAYTVSGSIVTNFVADKELTLPLFTSLAECKTFDQVTKVLRGFMEEHQSEEASALVWRIDRYLRRELLHVIRKRMGIAAFAFDSFIDDQKDVFEALCDDWGVAYSNALTKYQESFIKNLLGEGCVVFADDDRPLVSSEPPTTITLLDIDYGEFGVRINDDAAHEVFQSNFPGLYEFIHAVVGNNPEAMHHYIVTEDDFVYEVHRSIVGDELYVVSNGPALV